MLGGEGGGVADYDGGGVADYDGGGCGGGVSSDWIGEQEKNHHNCY